MPRTLVRAPSHDRMRSLGGLAVAWIEHFILHGPGAVQGMAVDLGDEYAKFVMDCYALEEEGRRLYDHAFLSRPKGTNKSGLGAMFALFEALGPARFDGYAEGTEVYEDPWGLGFRYEYEYGEPMGKHVHVPIIRIMATEEGQTGNVYDTIFYNLTDDESLLSQIPGVDPGRTRIYLPLGGEIIPSTASSASKDGGRETFVVFDESHLYNTPELRRMYKTVTRNLVKRKATSQTWFIETTTMFAPGEDSVAEVTFREAELVITGKRKRGRQRLLYDHRWGDCDDLTDEMALIAAIKDAFGEAITWNDIDAILDEFYSLRADPTDSRRFFLNAETSSSDSWLDARELDACKDAAKALEPGDVITLGFDGSIGGDDADSTALVACRVSDGHLELVGLWERPESLPRAMRKPKPVKRPTSEDDNDDGQAFIGEWRVDEVAVDALVDKMFKDYRVVGFFCDPPHWQSHINSWTAKFGKQLKARVTHARPLEFWTNRPTQMVQALSEFHLAVKGKQVSFTPAEDRLAEQQSNAVELRRHLLNCFRKPTKAGLQIRKEYPKSPRKIDGAMAAVLAYTARGQAIAAGVATGPRKKRLAKRIR
jgi:hypothetical protein